LLPFSVLSLNKTKLFAQLSKNKNVHREQSQSEFTKNMLLTQILFNSLLKLILQDGYHSK
jgi:hypothetical protein